MYNIDFDLFSKYSNANSKNMCSAMDMENIHLDPLMEFNMWFHFLYHVVLIIYDV